jgi:hypothetical protein
MKRNNFFASLKSLKKGIGSGVGSGAGSGAGFGSISQRYGSGDPDPQQYPSCENVPFQLVLVFFMSSGQRTEVKGILTF